MFTVHFKRSWQKSAKKEDYKYNYDDLEYREALTKYSEVGEQSSTTLALLGGEMYVGLLRDGKVEREYTLKTMVSK